LGLCLAGPTASGKTAIALSLAEHLPLEIISVDSALVYRGMDIGTAKPTVDERARVAHHLIDILEPDQTYSAARFAADAQRLALDIRGRGKLPLLVGGTMLYFKALRDGLDAMPPADAQTRAAIDAEAAAQGWPSMHQQLAAVDPLTAARLAPADAQRIQRALEVWRVSGKPLSAWHAQTKRRSGDIRAAAAQWPLVALEPDSRAWLHERIARRCDTMFSDGLIAEVQALQQQATLHADLPSMRCVGYRQIWSALNRGDGRTARDEVVAATRQLAKRQLTWLRSITDRKVLACDGESADIEALALLQAMALEVAR